MQIEIIIPARNEAPRISAVLKPLIELQAKNKGTINITVINDHSSDGTAELVRKNFPGVNLISVAGKGKKDAVLTGFKNALEKSPEVVVTLDADLKNLTAANVERLIEASREKGLAIGFLPHFLRGNLAFIKNFRIESSGQRAYQADKLKQLLADKKMAKLLKNGPRYGDEIALYIAFKRKFGQPTHVELNGVGHISKSNKGIKHPSAKNLQMLAQQLYYRLRAHRIRL